MNTFPVCLRGLSAEYWLSNRSVVLVSVLVPCRLQMPTSLETLPKRMCMYYFIKNNYNDNVLSVL